MLQAHEEPRDPAAGAGLTQLEAVFQMGTQSRTAIRWLVSEPVSKCHRLRLTSLSRYRVCGYGVKLITTASGEDVWQYTFTLERHNAQPCFDEALCRPSAEQMDDWNNYKKMTADLLKVEVNQLYHIVGKAKVIKSSADQPSDRRESGYFTGGSSEEEKTS